MSHWVLGEACLKAVGLAQSLPRRGELNLPAAPKDSGRTMLADGRAIAWRWGDAARDPDGCFIESMEARIPLPESTRRAVDRKSVV